MQRLIRPPLNFNIDDVRLGKQWLVFDFDRHPISAVLPFHGTGYLDRRKENIE
jgi:hypothetical protein